MEQRGRCWIDFRMLWNEDLSFLWWHLLVWYALNCYDLWRWRRRTRRTNMCYGQSSNAQPYKAFCYGTSSFLLKYGKWEVELWTVVSSYYIVMQLNKWNWNRRVQSKHTAHAHTRSPFSTYLYMYPYPYPFIHLCFSYALFLWICVCTLFACSTFTTLHFLDSYISLCVRERERVFARVFAITHPIRSYRYAWISI